MSFLRKKTRIFRFGSLVCVLLLPLSTRLVGDVSDTAIWGFGALEMFPVEPQIQFARSLDANNDGLSDLVVSNPRKSELTLLLNKSGQEEGSTKDPLSDTGFVNDLVNNFPPDARFRRQSILLQSRPKALMTGDLDQDDLPEIVFYDDREALNVLWNGKENAWSEKLEWRIPGGVSGSKSLMIEDLNMDGRPDIALLGEAWVSICYNKGARQFDRPQKIQIPSGVRSFEAIDVNHDDRLDLAFHIPNQRNGLYVSLRNLNSFNTFMQVPSVPMSKVHWLIDDTRDESLMLAISDHLDQIMAYTLDLESHAAPSEQNNDGVLQMIQFPDFSGIKRGVCWADLNGDNQDDCLVSDPDAGLLNVYLSNQNSGWDQPRVFPSLTGVEELAVMDWGLDGGLEVFLLSKGENQVGHSHWNPELQTLTYPEKLPSLTKPLVMESGLIGQGQNQQALVVLHENEEGWAVSSIRPDAPMKTQWFEGRFSGIPERLMMHDLDQDSLMDCIIFTPYEPLICLRQRVGNEYNLIKLVPPGGSWQGGWATTGDLDSDGIKELILPFKNMVRAFSMESRAHSTGTDTPKTDWSLRVVEQINGPSNTSNLQSAVVVKGDSIAETSVALYDLSGSRLHFARQDATGVWRVSESQEIPVSEFSGLQQLGNERGQEVMLLCLGKSEAVVNLIGGKSPVLNPLGKKRSEAKEARLQSLLSADFNRDGLFEIFALETSEHTIECLQLEADRSISLLNQWSVFEKRSYRNQGAAFAEPKEGIVADFTGDGLLDLSLIVHDRIILYPQRSWNGTTSDH
jgi:hypothetical protein